MGSTDWQVNKAVLECTKSILESKIYCDVNFKVGEDEDTIKAHKLILSMRSPVFDRMFNGGFQESEKDPVIRDVTVAAFQAVLRYCYYECLDIEDDVALSILYAAKKYMLPLLEEAAREKLIDIISVTNIWNIYEFAVSVGDTELLEECQIYFEGSISTVKEALQAEAFLNIPQEVLLDLLHINDKVDKVLDSKDKCVPFQDNVGISISEIELFKACNAWAEAKCIWQEIDPTGTNKRTMLGKGLFFIRFPTMLQRDLANVVYPTGILTPVEMVNLGQFKHKDPVFECLVDFPSKERQFVVTAANPCSSITKIGLEADVRVVLSRVWTLWPGSFRVTVRDETSGGSWSMPYNTKHQNHCTKVIGKRRKMLYWLDIKPQLLESGTKYSITAEKMKSSDPADLKLITKWVVIGGVSPFTEVKIIHSPDIQNCIYAVTVCLV